MIPTDLSNIAYCLRNGVMSRADVDRFLGFLIARPRIAWIAQEFGYTVSDTALYALDAGIVFVRARILTPEAGFFSPAPLADEGWDAMADNPDEREFYMNFCRTLCELVGIRIVVPEHHRFNEAERVMAKDFNAIGAVVAAMDRLALDYVPEHWPEGGGSCQGTGGDLPCGSFLTLEGATASS